MMRNGNGYPPHKPGGRTRAAAVSILLAWATSAILSGAANAQSAQTTPVAAEVSQLLIDAETALKAGNVDLALIRLKNAVRTAPDNAEAHARLGIAFLTKGQAADAERELRQAQADDGPKELIVPPLLRAMIERGEFKELLAQFPDPKRGSEENAAADVLRARATALQKLGRPKDARAAMDRAVASRRDVVNLIASAALAQEQDDLALARKQSDEALALSPDNSDALAFSVLLLRQTGDTQAALARADEFIKRVPSSMMARALRIETLLELKQDARAKEDVDLFLKLAPNSTYGRFYRALLMSRAKDFAGAWAQMQGLPPEFVQSQSSVALVAASMAIGSNRMESANAILNTWVANHPDDRYARLQLAAIRLKLDYAKAAEETLSPVRTSNDPAVHAQLGQAYLRLGRIDDAILSLEVSGAAAQNMPAKPSSALAGSASDQDIRRLKAVAQRDPHNVAAVAPLIAVSIAAGQWEEAENAAQALVNDTPDSPFPGFFQGQIAIARGRIADAEKALGRALEINPAFAPALYYRANVRAALGNLQGAEQDLQQIIAQTPAAMLATIRLSEIQAQNGQDAAALARLDDAIKKAPNDPRPRLALANWQVARKKNQAAQATFNELVAAQNLPAQALNSQIEFLGWLLRRDDPDNAIAFLSLAAAAVPRSSEVADALGWRKLQRGDRQAALTLLQQAHQLDSDNASFSYHLALALDAAGRRAEARTLVQAALAKSSHFDGAEEARNLLLRW